MARSRHPSVRGASLASEMSSKRRLGDAKRSGCGPRSRSFPRSPRWRAPVQDRPTADQLGERLRQREPVCLQLDGAGAHVQLGRRPLADGHAAVAFPLANCTYSNAKPSGYLAGRWESWKWGPNVGAWLVCGTQGWSYGGGTSCRSPFHDRLRRAATTYWVALRLQRRLGRRLAHQQLRVALS